MTFFDFFYDALPGYEEVGRRRILLGCWGSFQNPRVSYKYQTMTEWGRAMYVAAAWWASTANWSLPTWWTST